MQTVRAARGTKRTCTNCSERFYDLDRDPIVCPACNFVHDPSAFVHILPIVPVPEVKPKATPEKSDDDDLEIDDVELDDDDDDLVPDEDDLEDDSDIAVVAVDVDDDEEES